MSKLALVVRGRPIDTFHHKGKTYVEGRRGTQYEIQFYNDSNQRRKIVISVDGLNIMTGDSTWDRGYIVEPYQTVGIPGWRKSSDKTAAFEFSSLKESYNQHNVSGQTSSVGVIGCKVYKEKVKPAPIVYHNYHHYPWYWRPYEYPYYGHYYTNTASLGGGGGWVSTLQAQNMNMANDGHSVNLAASGSNFETSKATFNNSNAATHDMLPKSSDVLHSSANVLRSIVNDSPVAEVTPGPLGTGWGEDKTFHTTSIEFESEASPCETLVLYYDSFEGLKRRGVPVQEPIKAYVDPEPFPDGCPNPINR